jgi:hypothetical protein
MSTQRRFSGWQQARTIALTSLCAACVGTPTPEPPDYDPLPRPDAGGFMTTVRVLMPEVVDSALPPVMVPLTALPGTVAPESEVWLINLDEPSTSPLTLRADARGGFATIVTGRIGQRVRLLYRTARDHSLPLDLEITGNPMSAAIGPMRESAALPCLTITPPDEITRVVGEDGNMRGTFALSNSCAEPVTLERAELRFGDVGFRLTTPPDSVPANGRAELTVLFPANTDASERTDIVLLEAASGGARSRYALGVWARARGE